MIATKAITIWQPYATLLVTGQKLYETRSWATGYTGPIAIHAAKRSARQVIDALAASGQPEDWATLELMESLLGGLGSLDWLPQGEVIGVGILTRCNAITEDFRQTVSLQERRLGDWTPGRYAWEFKQLHSIEPVPAKGMQGLWNWEDCAIERKKDMHGGL